MPDLVAVGDGPPAFGGLCRLWGRLQSPHISWAMTRRTTTSSAFSGDPRHVGNDEVDPQ